ncbi:MAG TPA: hypothetical protein VFP20_00265 [Bacteroidales bacterium]|nr:hypothetical protein [Bacteroidales bacterium]
MSTEKQKTIIPVDSNNMDILQNVLIDVNGEKRMPAFASINRELNLKHVQLLCERMKVKGFRKGEEIKVFKCEEAHKEGILSVRDIDGNPIVEGFEKYFLVGDGQHRTFAVVEYNKWAIENVKQEIDVPAIIAELKDESISEYINDINVTRKDWSAVNYLESAAELHPDEELLQVYAKRIKEGYSISTLNKIYCEGRKFGEPDFKLLCFGIKEKGKRIVVNVIPSYNIQNGDRYIEILRSKKFADSEIAKRYIIDCFSDIRISDGLEFAFSVLETIAPNDYAAMMKNDKLVEAEVKSRFDYIKLKVKSKKLDDSNPNIDRKVSL